MKNFQVTNSNISNTYNLSDDDRLTLPDDSIFVFNYDMIKGHLEGFKLQGGNYIKISKIPAKTKIYWNSKFHRYSAKLLDESNRGMRILKQNNDLIMMTFQNFYIWTEGDLSDIENWSENQRMLQIEISGVGAEITPLIANPSSDIYVDKVESVGDINHLMNFGKGNTAVEAGNWATKMRSEAQSTSTNTEAIKDNTANSNTNELNIISELESANTTLTDIKLEAIDTNTNLSGIDTELVSANTYLNTANTTLSSIDSTLSDIHTTEQEISTKLETSNANTQSSATSLLAIKDKQAQDSLTLTNISANLIATKNNTDSISSLAKETTLQGFATATHTDLEANTTKLDDFKTANHTDLTTLTAKLETGLALLDSKLALLNLEATQQDIVSKINTINLQLNTMNTLLANGISTDSEMPSDYELTLSNAFLTRSSIKTELTTTKKINHKWHYHLQTGYLSLDKACSLCEININTNYQTQLELQVDIRIAKVVISNNTRKAFVLPKDSSATVGFYISEDGFTRKPLTKRIITANLNEIRCYGEKRLLETPNQLNKSLILGFDTLNINLENGLTEVPTIESGVYYLIVSASVEIFIKKIYLPKLV